MSSDILTPARANAAVNAAFLSVDDADADQPGPGRLDRGRLPETRPGDDVLVDFLLHARDVVDVDTGSQGGTANPKWALDADVQRALITECRAAVLVRAHKCGPLRQPVVDGDEPRERLTVQIPRQRADGEIAGEPEDGPELGLVRPILKELAARVGGAVGVHEQIPK